MATRTGVVRMPRTARAEPEVSRGPGWRRDAAWLAGGAAVAFLLPFVLSDLLSLDHDAFYLLYGLGVVYLVGGYVRGSALGWSPFVRNWRLSLALGAVASVALVFFILNRDSTPRPSGLYLAFEVLWRGVAYGAFDALLLTAFPVLLVLNFIRGDLRGVRRKAGFVVAAYALVFAFTLVYHAGYPQFRDNGFSEDGLRGPLTGSPIWSAPALLSANPAGAIVAHSAMHTTAVLHEYETDLFLPPRTMVNED